MQNKKNGDICSFIISHHFFVKFINAEQQSGDACLSIKNINIQTRMLGFKSRDPLVVLHLSFYIDLLYIYTTN